LNEKIWDKNMEQASINSIVAKKFVQLCGASREKAAIFMKSRTSLKVNSFFSLILATGYF